MATPRMIEEGKDAWKTYVTARTKAIPKNSLFGTSLENVDIMSARSINADEYINNNLKQRKAKLGQYEHKLPSRLQNKRAKDDIKTLGKVIDSKELELSDRQRALLAIEDRAKYFQSVPASLNQTSLTKKKLTLAEPGLDFETHSKMNTVGFGAKNSYNRDRYQKKAPVHQYAVIGDPLRQGMDFSLNKTETHEKFTKFQPIDPEMMKNYIVRKTAHKSAPAKLDDSEIPANIKAIYGSAFVDELFSNTERVNKVKSAMRRDHDVMFRKYQARELPPIEVQEPKNYADLSLALRMDKFGHGFTYHQPSLMKESHTKDVFDRRYKDPDEFRHQWDEYGKWMGLKLQWELQNKALGAMTKADKTTV